jgi:septum formation protein
MNGSTIMIETTPSSQPAASRLKHRLVLASGSPRRRELLHSLGLSFEVIKPDVDEEAFQLDHLVPKDIVKFLARTKAQEVFKRHNDAIVIGSDTIVVLNGAVFGKPKSEDDAFRMLKALQGNRHSVYTGITVFHPQNDPAFPPFACDSLQTEVYMRPLNDDEIRAYIATGEPMDKAGSYAIQGYGSTLVERIDGCYFNVVGMSLYLLERLFEQLGEKLVL